MIKLFQIGDSEKVLATVVATMELLKNKQYVNQSHHVSQRVFTKYRQAMTENEISKIILDCAFKVHTKLGSRLLEKVYR